MIINLVGECDKRPVIYTLMKVFQTLGDVLLLTSDNRLLRLSDTRENGGHYQNTMIASTQDSVDEFMDEFDYSFQDFTHAIVDNLVCSSATVTIYCHGIIDSDNEKDAIEYIDDVKHIHLYQGKGVLGTVMLACEKFESQRNMCPINQTVSNELAAILAGPLKTTEVNIAKMAMAPPIGEIPEAVAKNKIGLFEKQKKQKKGGLRRKK